MSLVFRLSFDIDTFVGGKVKETDDLLQQQKITNYFLFSDKQKNSK
jgi:hypothetical protein